MGVQLPSVPPPEVSRANPVGAVVRLLPSPPRPEREAVGERFRLNRVQRNVLVVVLCALSLVLWDSIVLLPLRLLVVTFHELGHAAMALLTGGRLVALSVGIDETGYTLTNGGSRILILNGGYVGSMLTGVGMLLASRTPSDARRASGIVGTVLAVVSVRYWGSDSVGLAIVMVSGVLLLGLATRSPGWLVDVVVRWVGWFSLLFALIDIREDILRGGVPERQSDAIALAALTGVSAPMWGMIWVSVGLLLLVVLRRRLS